MRLLLLLATAGAVALGWEVSPPPDLPPPPPPPPPPPTTPAAQPPDCRGSQATALSLEGDAVLLALLDLHTGANCEVLVTDSYRQMAAIAAVVSALPRMETVLPTKIGLTVLDTCSSARIAQKALVSELVFLECQNRYPLGILATESIEEAISGVAAGARERILRLAPAISAPLPNNERNVLWEALKELIELHWATVSVFMSPKVVGVDWLGTVTRENGICLLNSTSTSNLSASDATVVIGDLSDTLPNLTSSASRHRLRGQPLIVMPMDVVLTDAAFLPDDAMVLVSTTAEKAQAALLATVRLDSGARNSSVVSVGEVVHNLAAVAGFPLFMDVAKTVVRQVDGFTEIRKAKCNATASATGATIIAGPDHNLVLQWRKDEAWVAAVATVSAVGAVSALVIAGFMTARIFKGDILEGNPCASFILLFTVLFAYVAVLPFCVTIPGSNRGHWRDLLCAARVFGTSVAYGQMFAVMLSRALMLASCDRDGGFLTHVSGYVQSSVCVALASVPLWAVAASLMSGPATCASLANGRLYALLLGYDLLLLVLLLASTPFIATSKRNYREGAFFSAAAALCVSVWAAWWALYLSLPSHWHDAAAASGLSGTATAVLLTVFIPRTYMMMTAVVRDRLSSALPSLAYSTGGSGLVGGPLYFDPAAENMGPAMSNRGCDLDDGPTEASGTFRNAYRSRSPATRTPRALSPHDVTYERYESPNSPMKVTRF